MSRRANHQLKPVVEPLEVPMTPFAVVGTALWGVAGLLLLFVRDWLEDTGRTWWLWTCLSGVVAGLVGIYLMARRDARRSRSS